MFAGVGEPAECQGSRTTASDEHVTGAKYPKHFKKVIEENDYLLHIKSP